MRFWGIKRNVEKAIVFPIANRTAMLRQITLETHHFSKKTFSTETPAKTKIGLLELDPDSLGIVLGHLSLSSIYFLQLSCVKLSSVFTNYVISNFDAISSTTSSRYGLSMRKVNLGVRGGEKKTKYLIKANVFQIFLASENKYELRIFEEISTSIEKPKRATLKTCLRMGLPNLVELHAKFGVSIKRKDFLEMIDNFEIEELKNILAVAYGECAQLFDWDVEIKYRVFCSEHPSLNRFADGLGFVCPSVNCCEKYADHVGFLLFDLAQFFVPGNKHRYEEFYEVFKEDLQELHAIENLLVACMENSIFQESFCEFLIERGFGFNDPKCSPVWMAINNFNLKYLKLFMRYEHLKIPAEFCWLHDDPTGTMQPRSTHYNVNQLDAMLYCQLSLDCTINDFFQKATIDVRSFV